MTKVLERGDDTGMVEQGQDFRVQRPRWDQRIMMRIASSRFGAWWFSRTLYRMDLPVIRLSKGRGSLTSPATGLPVVTLTTRGAKTGKLYTTPLIGIPDGENVVVIASNWGRPHHAGWYYNLRANPEVTLSVKGSTGTYVAREAAGEEREEYWRRGVGLYRGYESYRQRTRRKIPIIVLTPKKS